MQNSNRWPLQSAVDWFMCALCGHLALPWLFKCTCRKCQRFGLNLDEQKRTFGQEIEKRLRYLFKLLYMSINASFLLGILVQDGKLFALDGGDVYRGIRHRRYVYILSAVSTV